ncbi:MAG TPA: hypothetical protein VEH80_03110 [Candidatus Bathyarchaeia archaeon]|nr:hypothetical protein [Candidatus Bathyarchaeia archaeon]
MPIFLMVALGGLLLATLVIFGAFLVALSRVEQVPPRIDREEPPRPLGFPPA